MLHLASGRADLPSIWAALTDSTTLLTIPHTITACFVLGDAVLPAVSAWQLRKGRQEEVFRLSLQLGAWVVLIADGGEMPQRAGRLMVRLSVPTFVVAGGLSVVDGTGPPRRDRLGSGGRCGPDAGRGGGSHPRTSGGLVDPGRWAARRGIHVG